MSMDTAEKRSCYECQDYRRGDCAGIRDPYTCSDYRFAGTAKPFSPVDFQGAYGNKTKVTTIDELKNGGKITAQPVDKPTVAHTDEEINEPAENHIIRLYHQKSATKSWYNAYDDDAKIVNKVLDYMLVSVNGHLRCGSPNKNKIISALKNAGYACVVIFGDPEFNE